MEALVSIQFRLLPSTTECHSGGSGFGLWNSAFHKQQFKPPTSSEIEICTNKRFAYAQQHCTIPKHRCMEESKQFGWTSLSFSNITKQQARITWGSDAKYAAESRKFQPP
mmetsp:Transcript_29011/g.60940  ORF Transcript_29011/g.60940 Transcript_29011/m.60940 type:complete len:110 (-) Transcript_29011:206-535(-)